jgi:hypothetical protein
MSGSIKIDMQQMSSDTLLQCRVSACRLNKPTPSTDCITHVENADFDTEYNFILIKSAKKGLRQTLDDAIARIVGRDVILLLNISKITSQDQENSIETNLHDLTFSDYSQLFLGINDFDPLNNELSWSESEQKTVLGWSHEDTVIFEFHACPNLSCSSRNDLEYNNLASQFLVRADSMGSVVVFKTLTDRSSANDNIVNKGDDRIVVDPTLHTDNKIVHLKELKITRREVWEIMDYRSNCSQMNVVSDRIHRINMQRSEGLLALKKMNMQVVDLDTKENLQ